MHHRLAVGHLADQGRVDRLAATHRIGNQHIRIRSGDVGLDAQHQARWKNIIIASLQPDEKAAGSGHEIKIEG
jgi:predicted dinucleotide-utilizing enzyme